MRHQEEAVNIYWSLTDSNTLEIASVQISNIGNVSWIKQNFIWKNNSIFELSLGSWYYKTKCPAIVIVDETSECFESQHVHQHDPSLAPPKNEKVPATTKNSIL